MTHSAWGMVWVAVGLGLGRFQAPPASADQMFTRLAIETAADGDVPPVEMRIGGVAQFAVYDRFRLTALAARAAFLAGHPFDPAAPPPDLLVPRLVVLAFARSPLGGDAPRPQSVRISDRTGRDVKQVGVLSAARLRALLPGVAVPPQTLAAEFALPSLRGSDRVAILFNDAFGARAMLTPTSSVPGNFAGPVVILGPKAKDTPPAVAPPDQTWTGQRLDVHVEGLLDLTGHVRYARALDGPPALQTAALAAVARWRYEPARMYDAPVPIMMTAVVSFGPHAAPAPIPTFARPLISPTLLR